jgi:hypothetical protein
MLSDGTGDALRITSNSDFAYGTGDFCFEFFIRPTTNLNGTYNVWEQRGDGEGVVVKPTIYISGNTIYYYTNGDNRISHGITLQSGTWYHLAVSRSGSSTRMWLNGTQVGSTYTDNNNYATSQVIIGAYSAGSSSYTGSTPAYFDEIRISKGVARYTANFTPSTTAFVNDANTVLLIHADGTDASTVFTDDVGTGRTQKGIQAIGNAQVDTAQSYFGGSSALFDGNGDYLTSAAGAVEFGSGDLTIEGWIRLNGNQNTRQIMGVGTAGSPGRSASIFLGGTQKVEAYWSNSGTGATAYNTGNTVVTANTWHHIAMVKSGTNVQIYLNGVADGSGQVGTASGSAYAGQSIFIGADTIYQFSGWLDEIRFSNIARYTANFTPSTTPFQNDANTVLLLHMDGTDASTVFFDDNGIAPYTP